MENIGRKELINCCNPSSFKNPRISVVTVVFNGEDCLEDTIKSILNQTYDNIEYIIIDGNSTDNTKKIITKYNDFIDYWISESDSGIYYAMNKGVDKATGEWIIFINAGDQFFNRNTIESIFMSDFYKDADLIYGHYQVQYGNNFCRIQKAKPLNCLWKGMIFSHQSLFVKLSIMKKHKFNTSYKISSDFEFIYTAYMQKYRFKNSNCIISSVNADGLSDIKRMQAIKEYWDIVTKFTKRNAKIDVFYIFLMIDAYLRYFLKSILPHIIVEMTVRIKYGKGVKKVL